MVQSGAHPVTPVSKRTLIISLQLLCSHALVGCLAMELYTWLMDAHLPYSSTWAVVIGSCGLVGLLLTLNLQCGLYKLAHLLERMTRTQITRNTGRAKSFIWAWPLQSHITRLDILSQRIEDYAREEKLSAEYREQMLEQARAAAAQEERNRIARDLHDSIKQQIFSISVSAAAAKAHMREDATSAREALEDIQHSTREVQVEMRALLQQLRSSPLEQTSLQEALQTQAEALGYRTGAQVECEIGDLPPADLLPPRAEEQLFRMVQEAFANIARHARAPHVWLTLRLEEERLCLSIRDDGQGFDLKQVRQGMGLANLHERARNLHTDLHIQSEPGNGTDIQVNIPLLRPQGQAEDEARVEVERQSLIERAQSGYQLSGSAALIALVLLNTNIPLVCALLALIVSAFGLAQGIYSRQSLRGFGAHAQVELKKLWQRESSLYLRLFGVIAGCLITVNIHERLWEQVYGSWVLIIESILIVGAILPLIWLRNQANERYFHHIAPDNLTWELTYISARSKRRLRSWLILTVLVLLYSRFIFTFPPHTVENWIDYLCLGGCVYWGLIILVEHLQLRRWRSRSEVSTDINAA